MDHITGTIQSISRAFGSQGWRVAELKGVGKITGNLPGDLEVGDYIAADGSWDEHPRYGRQFAAKTVRREIPTDTRGLRDYLDLHFPWVGPMTALRLIDAFGDALFSVIEREPLKLTSVAGITQTRAQEIHNRYLEVKEDMRHDQFFSRHMITPGLANRLIAEYGTKQRAIDAIQSNPYTLADEVWGVGFKKSDLIALSMGIKKDSRRRITAGIEWVLQDASQGEGHCCLPREELVRRASQILESGADKVGQMIDAKIQAGDLVEEGDFPGGHVYLADLHAAERDVAEKLRLLAETPQEETSNHLTEADWAVLDADQQRAVELSLKSRVMVLTGPPGTGKTYTLNMIIRAFGDDKEIVLAAPTGKAAKRMTESTGRQAKTIHRLLAYHPEFGFTVNRERPLTCDILVIDEASMIDVNLMHHLMDAITLKQVCIFTGDVYQLPSVGPGKVFGDMIDSGVIPVVRLMTLHRQAQDSYINRNAQRINRGERLELPDQSRLDSDFYFVQEEEPTKIPDVIRDAILSISQTRGVGLNDVQLLCPMRKGPVGTVNLNEFLRPILNPDAEPVKGTRFCVGDRVIQTRNDYGLEVFNGDVGVIEGMRNDPATESEALAVTFEDQAGPRTVFYSQIKQDNLQLAYALTIHKSQGSEFPVVVVPVHTTNFIQLRRNLLYTAITRAKRCVVLVGTMKAINICIRTIDANQRFTGLGKRLSGE